MLRQADGWDYRAERIGKVHASEMVCGTLTPTRGTVTVSGRLAALLELGAGLILLFRSENVYPNAALLGISREEVEERFEDIVEFAGIGEFVEHPVSTYSSGMYVRLAFATAVNTTRMSSLLMKHLWSGMSDLRVFVFPGMQKREDHFLCHPFSGSCSGALLSRNLSEIRGGSSKGDKTVIQIIWKIF